MDEEYAVKVLQSLRTQSLLATISVALLLGGCSFFTPSVRVAEPALTAAAPPAPPPAPAPVVEAAAKAAPPKPAPKPPIPAAPLRTAVLLSDDIPEFAAIAHEIELRTDSENLVIYNLDGKIANAARIKSQVSGTDQVIAIGLLAATVGREIASKRMVFCQVFNYQDYDLLAENSKGVSLLPPFDLQLERWTAIAPDLRSVGIITGPDQDDLVAEIRAATARHGIDLVTREVTSDKEALYAFKRITPDIQGLWLLPDNRILSPEVVREIMSYSARHGKQVLVFGTNLLGLGGLLSVTSDPADVAEQVLARLAQPAAGGSLPGPDLRALTKLRVELNPEIARRLGLKAAQPTPSLASKN
jgi:ABC-type uncharacterized transport system substrate-binding protein